MLLPHLENDMEKEKIEIRFHLGYPFAQHGHTCYTVGCCIDSVMVIDEIDIIRHRGIPRKQVLEHIRAIIDVELQQIEFEG